MKRFLFILSLLVVTTQLLEAQVDNYSLKLSATGSVDAGLLTELNGLDNYTVQLWMNPSVWTPNAAIFSRSSNNSNFDLRLGNSSGEIIFFVGNQSVSINSSNISVGNWSQIALVYQQGTFKALVNNVQVLQTTAQLTIPAANENFYLGNNFTGRIDEFRLWSSSLTSDYTLWRNTINKYHPQWNNLILYYKFDQNLCANVVDYKFKHHGVFSVLGAVRELVTDNLAFKYRINSAYTDFSRFADRGIDKEKYLLSNDIIMLGVESNADGTITMPFPFNHGTVTNGNYLNSYNGRNGVLALNGVDAKMDVGNKALTPNSKYSLHTWIYLEEWTEGAFIFKKEASSTQGFSIRLGSAATNELIVRLNGHEYKRNIPTAIVSSPVGSWWNLGVVAFSLDLGITKTFMFTFNGKAYFPPSTGVPTTLETTLLPQGVETTNAIVGENLHAKLDETVIWNTDLTEATITNYMNNGVPMPGFGKIVDAASVMAKMNSYWSYNNPNDVGYDYYSYKNFMNIVRSAFDGYRGYKIRMSVKGHTGWETTISDATKRKSLAQGIVQAAQEFDGIDLDLEWCYDGTCFNNYGLLLDEIGKIMPAEKIFSISPHYVSYALPTKYMVNVDYFNFQIYGPSPNLFNWSTYLDAYNRFIAQGYPKEKISLSYATTTSKACDDAAGTIVTAAAPIGVVSGSFNPPYTPDQNVALDSNGKYRFFTGVNQTRDRSEFIQEKDLAGIFYWDMGNDVPTSHKYSLPKASNYALASNVDTLVTKVNLLTSGLFPVMTNDAKLFNCYPNPVTDHFSVLIPADKEISEVKIFNTSGQPIIIQNRSIVNKSINIEKLKSGFYILNVVTTDGSNYKSTIVKK